MSLQTEKELLVTSITGHPKDELRQIISYSSIYIQPSDGLHSITLNVSFNDRNPSRLFEGLEPPKRNGTKDRN